MKIIFGRQFNDSLGLIHDIDELVPNRLAIKQNLIQASGFTCTYHW